jgi:hypothetical protein
MSVRRIEFDEGLQHIPRQLLVGARRQRRGSPSAGDVDRAYADGGEQRTVWL